MAKVTLANPLNDGATEIRVTFKPIMPPEWASMDREEREEWFNDDAEDVEIQLKAIEEDRDGEFVDVSNEWAGDVDELEEEIRTQYVERQRLMYLERLVG